MKEIRTHFLDVSFFFNLKILHLLTDLQMFKNFPSILLLEHNSIFSHVNYCEIIN